MSSNATKFVITDLVVASSATVSATFTNETWCIFMAVVVPSMDNGDIGMEISFDDGTTYVPIIDATDGADAVLVASGADPGVTDISDWVRFLPSNAHVKARFTCASQTSGAVTLKVIMRG